MKPWPKNPLLYEINTWVWLGELSRKAGRTLTLATVPVEEWERLAAWGFDAVWLMGIWERSPAGLAIANHNENLLAEFRRALPDFRTADNVGSPYCVRRYVVDEHLGGPSGLAAARQALAARGVGLILDFVPNHVAPDHPWVTEHPEYFIRGNREDLRHEPQSFVEMEGQVFACGRDPFFPPWPDVLQLNAFAPGLRQAAIGTLRDIAGQCDGVRCDMAMLMIDSVFERTWGTRAGAKLAADFWREIIPAIRAGHPDLKFLAEAYWSLEWDLQQQGFDFCYDKRLYDRLTSSPAEIVRQHLGSDLAFQEKLIRFIENHDEPRAAAVFPPDKARAAAVAFLTLPGARLIHEGQIEGRKVRLPIFLGRCPAEKLDAELEEFHRRLLQAVGAMVFRDGQWSLCERTGWPDNPSTGRLLAWCWQHENERRLIVVNLSGSPAQASLHLPWDELRRKRWRLRDELTGDAFERGGDEMRDSGLYVDLPPWHCHFLRFEAC